MYHSTPEDPFWQVGVITSVHGVKGQVVVKSFMENPEDITQVPVFYDASGQLEYILIFSSQKKDRFIASVKGVVDRSQAELLKQTPLYIPKSQLPALDEDVFYLQDLVGLKVLLSNGSVIGHVKSVDNFGAGDVIEIVKAEGQLNELYAFTREIFPTVDLVKGTILFCPPNEVIAKED